MHADADQRGSYDTLARAYGVRDLAISAVGVFGPPRAVRWAMGARIAGDLADCATLLARADEGAIRGKVDGRDPGLGRAQRRRPALGRGAALEPGEPVQAPAEVRAGRTPRPAGWP